MDILIFLARRVTANGALGKRRLGILDGLELLLKLSGLASHLGGGLMVVASNVRSDASLGSTFLLMLVLLGWLRYRLSFELLLLKMHVEL